MTELTDALAQTQAALQRSQAELLQLRAEVGALQAQRMPAPPPGSPSEAAAPDSSVREDIQALKEEQAILQAEVKQHEQTKVESASKYGLTVTGLALFNAYSNAGVVDERSSPPLPFRAMPDRLTEASEERFSRVFWVS